MYLSIIVPTKAAHSHIWDAIDSIYRCTSDSDFEVIIVVNKDSIATEEELERLKKKKRPRLNIIWPDKDLGIAGALNRGIEEATGNYIYITNDDIEILTKKWDRKFTRAFSKNQHIGSVGFKGNAVGFDKKVKNDIEGLEQLVKNIREAGNQDKILRRQEVAYHHTCSTFTSKDVLEKTGLYDESFWPHSCEDIDLGLRMMINGYRHFRVPLRHIHYGDKLGISRQGGATHNLIRDRDEQLRERHRRKVYEQNKKLFEERNR